MCRKYVDVDDGIGCDRCDFWYYYYCKKTSQITLEMKHWNIEKWYADSATIIYKNKTTGQPNENTQNWGKIKLQSSEKRKCTKSNPGIKRSDKDEIIVTQKSRILNPENEIKHMKTVIFMHIWKGNIKSKSDVKWKCTWDIPLPTI